jgi:hypothetical protein
VSEGKPVCDPHGIGPTPCPKCGVSSPLFDFQEVDIGVGMQVFGEEWECPEHGRFCFAFAQSGHSEPIFQEDTQVKKVEDLEK